MDSLTHIVLGACIGEAIAGKSLGKKALLIGAVAQSLPDCDIATSFFMPVANDLLAHRGFTHSLLFVLLVTPLLCLPLRMWLKNTKTGAPIAIGILVILIATELLTHLLIDCFTAYGTGLFEPFSHYRVSFNAIYVADPVFTVVPLVVTVLLVFKPLKWAKRRSVAKVSILFCSCYLLWALTAKAIVERSLGNAGKTIHITTPTPLNTLLWYVVSRNDSGFAAGYCSVLESRNPISYHFVRRNDSLLARYSGREDIAVLKRFSRQWYNIERHNGTNYFCIPLFGEIAVGMTDTPRMAFYYDLDHPEHNKSIIQRGRIEGWDKQKLVLFLRHMWGR